jgi:hypoxanthine phosphoribosyltransferase
VTLKLRDPRRDVCESCLFHEPVDFYNKPAPRAVCPIREGLARKTTVKQLLSEREIREGVERLAGELSRHYAPRPLTIIGVLTGSVVFVADLIRRLDMPLRVGVIQARSYRGAATRPGALEINDSMLPDIAGRDVLLVDDIFDTGRTLERLVEQMRSLGARSVRSAVLLRKQGRQEVPLVPDHVAFEIPDAFVVGYGLDYRDAFRHLPYLAVLDADDLAAGADA